MTKYKSLSLLVALLVANGLGTSAVASIHVDDFTGVYDVGNWTTTEGGDGMVDISGAPLSVVLTSSDAGSISLVSVSFTIAAAGSGSFEFDWDYVTQDAFLDSFFDPAFYINSTLFDLTVDGGAISQSGSISVPVVAGDTIGWQIDAFDDDFGEASLTISNFSAPGAGAIPEPTTFVVWSLLGLVSTCWFRRKTDV